MQIFKKTFLILLSLALCQCASYDFSRQVVQQGNLLTEKRIQRLKVGMSKQDVAILMGTSLLSPMFNNDRWDYAYTWRKGAGTSMVRNVVIYFKNDKVTRVVLYKNTK